MAEQHVDLWGHPLFADSKQRPPLVALCGVPLDGETEGTGDEAAVDCPQCKALLQLQRRLEARRSA